MSVAERVAVLYARVSTDEKDKQDPEQMIRTLRRYSEGRGWPIDSEHLDRVTGDPARRNGDPPGLRQALERVQKLGGRGVLVITEATRLVRSPVELLQLVARIQALPGAVASVEDGGDLDTTSDAGEIVLFMKGWFGRWYLKFVRRQTTRVLQDRQALVKEHGGFIAAKSKVWRTRLGRPSTPEVKVTILRAVWADGIGANEAARRAGVPASTARTWFARFKAEGAKNGGSESTAENGQNTGESKP